MDDYVYDSPPLVEVIAEVRWKLLPLSSMPVLPGIDPFYQKTLDRLTAAFATQGIAHIEQLLPPGAPLEMFGHQVAKRFRRKADSWPCYQFGPGVFAVNLIPPYRGWADFRSALSDGLGTLMKHHPALDELDLSQIELRYIDVFTTRHGFRSHASFVHDQLGIVPSLSRELLSKYVEGGAADVTSLLESRFDVANLQGSKGTIQIMPHRLSDGTAATSVFFSCRNDQLKNKELSELMSWYDEAHLRLRDWFELMIPESVRKTFGDRRPIE